tara:strand:+ start:222 stop:458 length:237 start_codon:yes stop_codon:yes gene_type:complete
MADLKLLSALLKEIRETLEDRPPDPQEAAEIIDALSGALIAVSRLIEKPVLRLVVKATAAALKEVAADMSTAEHSEVD